MAKNYDPRRVKSYRSYKVRDVCRLYKEEKLHPQTVRGWVNDGLLEGFYHGKTLYIYGAVLKQFLTIRNAGRKSPLAFDQFKCWKCKAVDTPLDNVITKLETGLNGCIKAEGICQSCGQEMSRNYKKGSEAEIFKCFTVEYSTLGGLYDSSCSTRKTNIKRASEIASSESLKTKPPSSKKKSISTNNQTNINAMQLSLFE